MVIFKNLLGLVWHSVMITWHALKLEVTASFFIFCCCFFSERSLLTIVSEKVPLKWLMNLEIWRSNKRLNATKQKYTEKYEADEYTINYWHKTQISDLVNKIIFRERKNAWAVSSNENYKTACYVYNKLTNKRQDNLHIHLCIGADYLYARPWMKGCPRRETKLHQMKRLQFGRSEKCEVPLHCHYSLFHF